MPRLLVDGLLPIENGSTISDTSADIGVESGASGTVDVERTGSLLTLTNDITIGDAGSGLLSIQNDATVAAEDLYIGYQVSSSGTVDIAGGSYLDIANNMTVGNTGTFYMYGDTTVVHVGGDLDNYGTFVQYGGTIDPVGLAIAHSGHLFGAGHEEYSGPIVNAGTVLATGDLVISAPSIIAGARQQGALAIGNGGTLTLDVSKVDGNQAVDFLSNSGDLTLGSAGGFGATIHNFGGADQIVLTDTSVTSARYEAANGSLALFGTAGQEVGMLKFAGTAGGAGMNFIHGNGSTPEAGGPSSARAGVQPASWDSVASAQSAHGWLPDAAATALADAETSSVFRTAAGIVGSGSTVSAGGGFLISHDAQGATVITHS